VRRTDPLAADRRGDARDERTGSGRAARADAAVNGDHLHVGLYGYGRGPSRRARPRRRGSPKAVYPVPARWQGPSATGHVPRRSCPRGAADRGGGPEGTPRRRGKRKLRWILSSVITVDLKSAR